MSSQCLYKNKSAEDLLRIPAIRDIVLYYEYSPMVMTDELYERVFLKRTCLQPVYLEIGIKLINFRNPEQYIVYFDTVTVSNIFKEREDGHDRYYLSIKFSPYKIAQYNGLRIHTELLGTQKLDFFKTSETMIGVQCYDFITISLFCDHASRFTAFWWNNFRKLDSMNDFSSILGPRKKKRVSAEKSIWMENMLDPELAAKIEFSKNGILTRNKFYKKEVAEEETK